MFDFSIQLATTNALLERIATALERAVGPDLTLGPVEYKHRKRGPESIVSYGNQERSWLKENASSLIQEKGTPTGTSETKHSRETMEEYDQSVENQALDPFGDL